ncbi:hypothetical protein BGX27_011375, partial [Mortierella sp. AM989]
MPGETKSTPSVSTVQMDEIQTQRQEIVSKPEEDEKQQQVNELYQQTNETDEKNPDTPTLHSNASTIETMPYFAPPDGGYGWVVVSACFLNNFTMLGIMFSWGIFQQLYTAEIFPGQVSAVSWIGTSAFGCMYIFGGFFSMFAARIGYRTMILVGSIFVTGGLVAASFATE